MTNTQLDRVAAELSLVQPANYRALSRDPPVKPIGREPVYWFYDDPDAVIHASRFPVCKSASSGISTIPPVSPPPIVAADHSR